MRYVAAAALHQKALQILSVIEDAENRIEGTKQEIDLMGLVCKNWREELSIWPMGKPSDREIEKTKAQKSAHEAAHKRLCKYYQNILSRLIDIA
jgi:hypothetical protein